MRKMGICEYIFSKIECRWVFKWKSICNKIYREHALFWLWHWTKPVCIVASVTATDRWIYFISHYHKMWLSWTSRVSGIFLFYNQPYTNSQNSCSSIRSQMMWRGITGYWWNEPFLIQWFTIHFQWSLIYTII
jgi:hypothetical protein